MAGTAALRSLKIMQGAGLLFPRLSGAAALRPWILQSTKFLELPRMVGYADLRAFELRTFRGGWHEELAYLYANQIERERRVLLGVDSSLEFYTQRGTATELRQTLTRDFSVYHVTTLAGPEEWFCDFLETGNPWDLIREITELCLNTHGQCLTLK